MTVFHATTVQSFQGAHRRPDILDMSMGEMEEFMDSLGERPYRARQLCKWLFQKGVFDVESMTDFSKDLRNRLVRSCRVGLNMPEKTLLSKDTTRKFLFRLADGNCIESVLIPARGHLTLCMSTQVGCAMGCAFCLTGKGGLVRNLTSGEILNQYLAARKLSEGGSPLTNIVLMGMGEPLANYEQTAKAVRILTSEGGVQFGRRRITVSTVGLAPLIPRLGRELDVNLAVSLNAPDDETRSRIMPVNRTYPISQLLQACREFPLTKGRRITFEYILIGGVNDSSEQAEKLAKLLRPVKAKINLIPYNEHPGSPFVSPAPETVLRFQEVLVARRYTAIIRKSMGRDILAACGQLAGSTEKT